MIVKVILGIAIGAGIGGLMGHFGQCSSGTCPLTANPFRGAIYGGVMGLLFALSFGGTARPAPSATPAEEQPEPGRGVIHISSAEEFTRYVVDATMPCLADFYSDHCPPCRQLAPTIEKLAEKENRSLSSFIINAVLTYIKQHHNIDWHKAKKKPMKYIFLD